MSMQEEVHEQLAAVRKAYENIESKFCVEGKISSDIAIELPGEEETSERISFPVKNSQRDAVLAPLLSRTEDSPFGAGNATVLDPSVRRATQLKPDKFQLVTTSSVVSSSSSSSSSSASSSSSSSPFEIPGAVLEQIRAELVPECAAVEVRLHKLNCYGVGGHFAKHKDTPRNATTHFGTLVVALPSKFEGGDLVVQHGGQVVNALQASKADFEPRYGYGYGYSYGYGCYGAQAEAKRREHAAKVAEHVPSNTIRWAAFFGDAEHEVQPVTEGCRVTLSYELHRDVAPDPTADLLLLRAEGLRRAFRGLLEDPAALPEGAQLGFECKHLYEEKALSGAEKALEKAEQKALLSSLSSSSSKKKAQSLLSVKKDLKLLKNEDAVTACAAAAAGLSVSFYRVLSESCCGDSEWVLPKMPTAARFGKKRRVDGGYMAKGITDDEIDGMALGRLGEDLPIEWVSTKRGRLANGSKPFAELEWAATGYFGNEACHTTFYTRAVLVVAVPDADSRAMIAAVRPDRALTAEQVHPAAPPSSTTAPSSSSSSKKRPADDMANGAGASSRGGVIDLTSDPAETTIAATAATATSAASSSSSSSSSSASSHMLYAAAAPTHSATGPRTIHVEGGEGGRSARMGGKCEVVLRPGDGLRELKKRIRDAFGKYKYHVLGSLRLVEGEGMRDAKKEDLVDGATVRCTYKYQSGNGNLGGFLGRGGGFGRGFAYRGFW